QYEPGFYRTLPATLGGKEVLEGMIEMGHDVRICTSPILASRTVVMEKYEWIEEHLGSEWIARTIVTRDKTIIKGHILIDDRPDFEKYRYAPEWEHVLFDFPTNRHVA